MRGNQVGTREVGIREGSIPAHAGEPPFPCTALRGARVYPRTCGGTVRKTIRTCPARQRSIPAHAGEPLTFKLLNLKRFGDLHLQFFNP